MSGGLVALFDDVAALARIAAASVDDVAGAAGRASTKAAGVVIDDTAVTPQYVRGVAAQRELPIIKKIAIGSLRNKLLFILPAALLLSQFVPWAVTLVLMAGGTYLAFEGAEKVWARLRGHHDAEAMPAAELGPEQEKALVSGAIRTDFILSAEIMVIALNEVAKEPLVTRAIILTVVAIAITLLVYGVVALIVKMDDIGLHLVENGSSRTQRVGHAMVRAMPRLLAGVALVGTVAMLWVGGHILLVGANELAWSAPYDAVHHMETAVADATGALGSVAGWLTNTLFSAIVGCVVGAVVVAVMHLVPRRGGHGAPAAPY